MKENLIGRYVKALVDYPVGGVVKMDEIGIIIKNRVANFPSQPYYELFENWQTNHTDILQLLPIGFNPNKKHYEIY